MRYLICFFLLLAAWPPLANELPQTDPEQLSELKNVLIVDVRTPEEYAAGHIPNAINLPLQQLIETKTLPAILADQTIVVYCRSGRRSGLALQHIKALGHAQFSQLNGDFLLWQQQGRPIEH